MARHCGQYHLGDECQGMEAESKAASDLRAIHPNVRAQIVSNLPRAQWVTMSNVEKLEFVKERMPTNMDEFYNRDLRRMQSLISNEEFLMEENRPFKRLHQQVLDQHVLGLHEGITAAFVDQCDVISLGCACHVSHALEGMGLRKFAYPFDWVRSPVEGIIHCLETNFEFFITFASKKNVGNQTGLISTDWGGSFWNHNLSDPEIVKGFERRIGRLLAHSASSAGPNLVFVRAMNSNEEFYTALQLYEALQRKFPGCFVFLLMMANFQDVKKPIRLADQKRILFFCTNQTRKADPEGIAFAMRFWAGSVDAATVKVAASLSQLDAMCAPWHGGSPATELFCVEVEDN